MSKKKKESVAPVIPPEEPAFAEPKESKRSLAPEEFEVRDLTWAVGVKCSCGHELDLFTWNIPEERVCKRCGKKYDVELKAYEVY